LDKCNIVNLACKQLLFYVRDLLDFSANKENKMKKDIKLFDIKDCLNEIVSIMQF
jgi:hypothetical protein